MKFKRRYMIIVFSINVSIIVAVYWFFSSGDIDLGRQSLDLEAILPYFVVSLFFIVGISFFAFIWRSRKQSLRLIQMELDEGKKMYFNTRVGGYLDGWRYRGPLLKLVVFDDCFIIKDKKVLFSDIESISNHRFSGVKVQINKGLHLDGQTIGIYDSSFLQFIPKEHGGQKEPQA